MKEKREKISDKIEKIRAFIEQYPEIWKDSYWNRNFSLYDYNFDNLEEIKRQYDEVLKCYDYLRFRYSQGKLKPEIIEQIKNTGVGRIFGTSDEYESQVEEAAKKYKIDRNTVESILSNYKSVEEYCEVYKRTIINDGSPNGIKGVGVYPESIYSFDISSPDLMLRDERVEKIYSELLDGQIPLFIDVEDFLDKLNSLVSSNRISEMYLRVYLKHYGLCGEESENKKKIASEFGVSPTRIGQIINRVIVFVRYIVKQDSVKLDYESQKRFLSTFFDNHDIFKSAGPEEMNEDLRKELLDIVYQGVMQHDKRKYDLYLLHSEATKGWSLENDERKRILDIFNKINGTSYDYKDSDWLRQLDSIIDSPEIDEMVDSIKNNNRKSLDDTKLFDIDISPEIYYRLKRHRLTSLKTILEMKKEELKAQCSLTDEQVDEINNGIYQFYPELDSSIDENEKKKKMTLLRFGLDESTISILKTIDILTVGELVSGKMDDIYSAFSENRLDFVRMLEKVHSEGVFFDEELLEKEYSDPIKDPKIQYRPIKTLDISTKDKTMLTRRGVYTVGEFVGRYEDIVKYRKVSVQVINEMKNQLHSLGVYLNGEERPTIDSQDIGKSTYSAQAHECDEASKVIKALENDKEKKNINQ